MKNREHDHSLKSHPKLQQQVIPKKAKTIPHTHLLIIYPNQQTLSIIHILIFPNQCVVFVQYIIVKKQKMKESKTWTQDEDKVLRELREQRGIKKWSQISLTMELEFEMAGKSGKRCRERYFNYASSLVKRDQWSLEQEKALFRLHNQKGNKWMQIAKELQRPDNAVKNHYHSKLRKALRKVNKFVYQYLRNDFKSIKNSILPKILQTAQEYYTQGDKLEETTAKKCFDMKNTILRYLELKSQKLCQKQIASLKSLVKEANYFNKTFKKRKSKKEYSKRVRCNEYKGKQILKLIKQNKKKDQQAALEDISGSQEENSMQSSSQSQIDEEINQQNVEGQRINQERHRNKERAQNEVSNPINGLVALQHLPYSLPIPMPMQFIFINPFVGHLPCQSLTNFRTLPNRFGFPH